MDLRACLGIVVLLLVGCTLPRPPVRDFGVADTQDLLQLDSDDQAYRRVNFKSLEPHEGYTLSFVELNGDGTPHEGQLDCAIESILRAQGEKSVVVLFVHGWGHSADALDLHVVEFRRVLSRLASDLRESERSVVGIYLGWPAQRLKKPFHFLTFLGRDRAANRISESPGAERVLRELQQSVEMQRRAGKEVVTVAIGHSLGGKFLFSPMEKRLKQKALWPASPAELPLFGDLVLLLNPAQDTNDFGYFVEYSSALGSSERLVPVMVVFSSEADMVVGKIYRIGRIVRTLGFRSKWRDFKSETTGLGWSDEQVTDSLCPVDPSKAAGKACRGSQWPIPVEVLTYDETELRHYSNWRGPFRVVRVDGNIVTGHGDMFNETFTSFLRKFIATRKGAAGY